MLRGDNTKGVLLVTTPLAINTYDAAADLDQLRDRIAGQVVLPGDDLYQEARRLHDFQYDRFPSVVVRVAETTDIAEAVKFARRHRLPFTVRSGGHSQGGLSVMDGTLVIDLSQFKRVVIDPERQVARVQAGATSGDLAGPAHAYGLALSTGDASSVGLGGLATGGGIGWFVRKYGLTADRLRSAVVVTAGGEILRASPTEHPDLLWAIRGGGGNFGIVVEFEFQLVPVSFVHAGALVLPLSREVVRGYLDYALCAPDELTTISAIGFAPPAPFIPEDRVGEPSLLILAVWVGDREEGDRALEPLRNLAPAIADTIGPIPYPAMFEYTAPASAPHGAALRSMFTNEIPDSAIDEMIASLASATSPVSMVQIRPLGGQLARIDRDSTAFVHRDKNFLIAVLGLWLEENDNGDAHRNWVETLWSKIEHIRDGVYSNFLGVEGEARTREAYSESVYRRLAEVKAVYDPDNVFRYNQNIRPQQVQQQAA